MSLMKWVAAGFSLQAAVGIVAAAALVGCSSTVAAPPTSGGVGTTVEPDRWYIKIDNDTDYPIQVGRQWSYQIDSEWHREGDPFCMAAHASLLTDIAYNSRFTDPQGRLHIFVMPTEGCKGNNIREFTSSTCTFNFAGEGTKKFTGSARVYKDSHGQYALDFQCKT
jgi:hypothetical protein